MASPAIAPSRAPAPARRAPARRAPAKRAPARGASATRAPASRGRVARNRSNGPKTRQTRASTRAATRPRLVRGPRPNPALAGAALIPQAAVGAAGAVRDLSDSGLIVRLTRGRGWIAVLSVLLGGIVALNVVSLSLNAGSGRIEQRIEQLERANSGLRASLAEELSASRVQNAAAYGGYYVPAPEDVSYLTADEAALEKLVRLINNETVLSSPAPELSGAADTSTVVAPVGTAAPVAPEGAYTAPPAAPAPAPSAPAPSPAPAPSTGGTGGVGL